MDMPMLKGPDIWRSLPANILSAEGKKIVDKDPNLGAATMKLLIKTEGPPRKPAKFYFGYDDDYDDIGIATLSMCIMEDQKATLAEVVARYALTKGTQFAETASAIIELRERKGLNICSVNAKTGVRWTPWIPSSEAQRPPSKKGNNLL